MTIFLLILKILGIILLILLALILWIILIPRHFWVEYSKKDGLIAKMNILFFRIRLYPLPAFLQKDKEEKKSKKDKSDNKESAGTKKEKKEKKEKQSISMDILKEIDFSFDLVKQIINAASGIMKRIFRAIKFTDVSFTVPLHAQDARDTRKLYGNVQTAFANFNVFLRHFIQIYYKCPLFVADYTGKFADSTYFYTKITASPVLLLMSGIYAFKQYRHIMNSNTEKADKE